ncbi:MAG: M20/M25/M40 family metallo-hydrolase [Smithellaceae bacterium]
MNHAIHVGIYDFPDIVHILRCEESAPTHAGVIENIVYSVSPLDAGEEFHRWLVSRIADDRIQIEMIQTSPPSGIAPLDNLFYQVVTETVKKHSPEAGVFPLLMAGASDGHYWRCLGYPAYGFTPMILERADIGRVHGIDERISIDNLLFGIKMTKDVIKTLCG